MLQALDLDLALTGFDTAELKMLMAPPVAGGLTDPDDPSSASAIAFQGLTGIDLHVPPTRAMNVVTAVITAQRRFTEMTTFTIDNENQIMAYGSAEEAKGNPEAQQFTSVKQLAKLADKWPATRLVELWNSLPGQKPVKKLVDRKATVARIWAVIQSVAPASAPQPPAVAPEKPKASVTSDAAEHAPAVALTKPKAGKRVTAAKASKAPENRKASEGSKAGARAGSKTARVLGLLKRPGGATLKAIMAYTGWQAHSVRGFISGTLGTKMSLDILSAKGDDGERTYSLRG